MLCKVCGAQIPEGAEKCEMCGAQVDAAQIEETIKNTEEYDDFGKNGSEKSGAEEIFDHNERLRREQMQKTLENKKHQLSEIEKRRNEKRRKQKRARVMLVALISALAVAAAGIGAYYVVQNVNSNNTADTTPIPQETLAVVTPVPANTASTSPSPEASASSAPDSSSAPQQSWTASGSTGGGSASSSGTSGAPSNNGNTSSSGGSSSGSSSSSASRPSSGGSSSGGSSSSANGTSSGGSSSSGSSSSSSGSSQSLPNVSQSGVSNSKISSALAAGNEVIYNSATGKYLMTFIIGNTKYYANVSAGSTTAQIQNKAYTITADPTQETYNGNTVYEITSMTGYDGKDYILPYSGTRLITDSDIKGMSKYDLALARNEIYARHGRKFQTAEYSAYFSGKAWYSINPNYNYSDDNSNLNEIEIKNVDFILSAERK